MRVVTGYRCPAVAFFATTGRRTPRRDCPLQRAGCADR
nr:MAG TPA: hypothetical protein [Caudoviricetes sp.]